MVFSPLNFLKGTNMNKLITKATCFYSMLLLLIHLLITIDKGTINGLTIIEILVVGPLWVLSNTITEEEIKTITGINKIKKLLNKSR